MPLMKTKPKQVVKIKQTTVSPGIISEMRSFSLWKEGYNEEFA